MTADVVQKVPASLERRFFACMALAILSSVILGFSRSFFLRSWFPEVAARTPQETFFYFHGAVFAAWFALLIVQVTLVAKRRLDLHRKLGWFGAILSLAMIIMGVAGAIIAARRPTGFHGIPMPGQQFMIIPIGDMALFALFVGLAIAQRSNPQAHKRLMLVASISILTAAIARWPFAIMAGGPPVFFGLTDLFLVPLVAWDLATRRRLHPVTLWGGLLLIVSQPLRLVLSGTETWSRIAAWLVS